MEIRDFAETILYGLDMNAKLARPPSFTDLRPGPSVSVPTAPGRSKKISFSNSGLKGFELPTRSELETEQCRGAVLHSFANHELLALEIMAAVLLRFPDAPAGFRRGLVATMLDEQRHLRLYMERMEAFGVELGDFGLNRFFWDCLKNIQSPLDFVAGMSLTFEQANLDFSQYWMGRFNEIGDRETQRLLSVVYEDEIRHVRHGLHWFRDWKPPEQDDFEAHHERLGFPLSLRRAKGRTFDVSGRLRAGLSADYVEALRVYERSRGRPPRIFWFNAGAESEVSGNFSSTRVERAILADLAPLLGLFANRQDCVICPRAPSVAFRGQLASVGIHLPEILVGESPDEVSPGHAHIEQVIPWGLSPRVESQLAGWVTRSTLPRWRPMWRAFYSKAWAAAQLKSWVESTNDPRCLSTEQVGRVVRTPFEVLTSSRESPLVIKHPFSTSGRNRRFIRTEAEWEEHRSWLEGAVNDSVDLVMEPWLEREIDLSVQLRIEATVIDLLGLTRFWTSPGGRYRGAWIGRWDQTLSTRHRRAMNSTEHGVSLLERLKDMALTVGKALQASEFHGHVGVDAFLFREQSDIKLKPLVELNPRMTMGLVALELRRKIASKSCGFWAFLSRRELELSGFESISAFGRFAMTRAEQVVVNGRLARGVLFTTDPSQATSIVTAIFVGRDLEEARSVWAECVGETSPLSSWFD